MKKIVAAFFISFTLIFALSTSSSAQMMQQTSPMMALPSVTPSPNDVQDIQTGKDLFTKFQNRELSCANLQNDDFEKIGEYLMEQSFGGNTAAHIQMNNTMKQMMGDQGEEQMHIRLAKNATGCLANGQGGVGNMMGNWGWQGSMMGWNGAFGVFGFFAALFWLVSFIDLILLGIFLWQRIRRGK